MRHLIIISFFLVLTHLISSDPTQAEEVRSPSHLFIYSVEARQVVKADLPEELQESFWNSNDFLGVASAQILNRIDPSFAEDCVLVDVRSGGGAHGIISNSGVIVTNAPLHANFRSEIENLICPNKGACYVTIQMEDRLLERYFLDISARNREEQNIPDFLPLGSFTRLGLQAKSCQQGRHGYSNVKEFKLSEEMKTALPGFYELKNVELRLLIQTKFWPAGEERYEQRAQLITDTSGFE